MPSRATRETDEALLERMRAALAAKPVTEQRMFGGVCFMLSGNMLAALSKRGMLVRVGKEAHARALAEPHTRPMDMRGKPMEGYLYVEPAGTESDEGLHRWLGLALAYVDALPAKAKKAPNR